MLTCTKKAPRDIHIESTPYGSGNFRFRLKVGFPFPEWTTKLLWPSAVTPKSAANDPEEDALPTSTLPSRESLEAKVLSLRPKLKFRSRLPEENRFQISLAVPSFIR